MKENEMSDLLLLNANAVWLDTELIYSFWNQILLCDVKASECYCTNKQAIWKDYNLHVFLD